jgi:hypothetical protein
MVVNDKNQITAITTEPASTTRILSHELGHTTGIGDTGPGQMDNIIKNENPIMIPLEGKERISY